LSSSAAAAQSLNVATRYPITASEKHCISTQCTIGTHTTDAMCVTNKTVSQVQQQKKVAKNIGIQHGKVNMTIYQRTLYMTSEV